MSYDLKNGDWIRPGSNRLEAVLRRRNPGIGTELVLHSLELSLKYRTLPTRV